MSWFKKTIKEVQETEESMLRPHVLSCRHCWIRDNGSVMPCAVALGITQAYRRKKFFGDGK